MTRKMTITVLMTIMLIPTAMNAYSTSTMIDTTDLKAYYKFDDVDLNGNILHNHADFAGGLGANVDGDINGVTTGEIGISHEAFSFDGTNDEVQLGTNADNFKFMSDSNSMKWSTSFWMKPHSASITGGDHIISNHHSNVAHAGFSINVQSDNVLHMGITKKSSTFVANCSTSNDYIPSDQDWHHYVIVYDHTLSSDNAKIYRDGANEESCDKISEPIADSPVRVPFIAYNGLTNYFDADLDELSIWSRALNSTEVSQLYDNGVPSEMDLQSQIIDLQSQIIDLQSQITSVNGTVTTLNTQVTVLDTLVDYIDTFLDGIFLNYEP